MGIAIDRPQVNQLLNSAGPVFHLRAADDAGVSRAVIRREEKRGYLTRVAKASFVSADIWEVADGWERLRLRAIGFGQCTDADTHVTGWAAALLLGLPTLGQPPTLLTALRPGDPHTASNRTPYGRVRTGHLPVHQRWHRSGVAVTGPASTTVDVARHHGATAGLVIADAVLASGVPRESLAKIATAMTHYPGIRTAEWVITRADPRAESPLETLGRLAFLSAGREPPLSNVWITAGGRWFRVDHLLPDDGLVLEADGAVKYDNRPDAAQIVADQVERERLLRSVGLGVLRYRASHVIGDSRSLLRRVDAEIGVVGRRPFRAWHFDGPRSTFRLAAGANMSILGQV